MTDWKHILLQAQAKIRGYRSIVVLCGGDSDEREVSLVSAGFVYECLRDLGLSVEKWDVQDWRHGLDKLSSAQIDKAVLMFHGGAGEDGRVQAALDLLGIDYTGSHYDACALAMDKMRSKSLWQQAGLPVPSARYLTKEERATLRWERPIVIKPVREGSSFGLEMVYRAHDLPDALVRVEQYEHLMVEEMIQGCEITVAMLAGHLLPPIEIKPATGVYDYHAKYVADDTAFICPAKLSVEQQDAINKLSLQALETIGAKGWGRVDFMIDEEGQPFLLEVNLIPGMTDHSLVPTAAQAVGLSYADLVTIISAH